MNYTQQLLTIDWIIKANYIKLRDKVCQVCGTDKKLNVHHIYYDNRLKAWQYPDESLITLCERHHKIEHDALKYFKNINLDIKEALISGMLAIDLFNKIYLYKEKTILE